MASRFFVLALGAATISAGGAYAAYNWQNMQGDSGEPQTLAPVSAQVNEAVETACGLVNGAAGAGAEAGVTEAITRTRVFMSQPLSADEDPAERIAAGDCRYSLAGLWSEDIVLNIDQGEPQSEEEYVAASLAAAEARTAGDEHGADMADESERVAVANREAGQFTGLSGSDPAALTNGTFVTPRQLAIEVSEDGTALTIRNAFGEAEDDSEILHATAADQVPMEQVMRANGERKSFTAQMGGEDVSIFVDVLRSGRVRLQIDGVNFYRPDAAAMQAMEVRSDDAWMIERNLDNLSASLTGYDIVTQNPMLLNEGRKRAVFAESDPRSYSIVEKRTVPLGLKLVPHGESGTVQGTRMIRTSMQFQQMVGANMGANVSAGLGKAAGASAGVEFAFDRTQGMREDNASSLSWGYSRHKLYSLVMDRPFSRLSEDFTNAVYAAHRFGEYDALVRDYGTHYPYSVTYGSAQLLWAEFKSQTLANWQEQGWSVDVEGSVAMKGLEVGASAGVESRTQQQQERLEEAQDSKVEAIGGNGSFSADGFTTGTPYPILADLRPMHELLNPLNFPDNPEIYTEAREELRAAINRYLESHEIELSDVAPKLPPPNLPQTYVIRPESIWCVEYRGKIGGEDKIELTGELSLVAREGSTTLDTQEVGSWNWDSRINLNCNEGESGKRPINIKAAAINISDTRRSLERTRFHYTGRIDEDDKFASPRRLASGTMGSRRLPVGSLERGQHRNFTFKIRDEKDRNDIYIRTRVERIQ